MSPSSASNTATFPQTAPVVVEFFTNHTPKSVGASPALATARKAAADRIREQRNAERAVLIDAVKWRATQAGDVSMLNALDHIPSAMATLRVVLDGLRNITVKDLVSADLLCELTEDNWLDEEFEFVNEIRDALFAILEGRQEECREEIDEEVQRFAEEEASAAAVA